MDCRSHEPLSGAHIRIPELHSVMSTDQSGYFGIKNVESPVTFIVSYIGYRDTTFTVYPLKNNLLEIFMERDSLEFASIVITATRTHQSAEDLPQSINIIDEKTILGFPATNTDDLLRMVPGINVNRSWGIFSRNASVTMRGMPGSARSLILLDGVPLNKTAGGTVSWHLVTPEEIERIEVVKGPGSTLYGNNAMGGVINIITKQPEENLQGFAGLSYGTYHTFQSQLNFSKNHYKKSKGFFWKLGSFYRHGDGYILEPGEIKDSVNVNAFLYEGNFNGLAGYRFSNNARIELDYRFYKDKRGSGVKVYEPDGSYEGFTNNNIRLAYEGMAGMLKFNAKAFYFNEYYYRQNENLNTSSEYKLVDTETNKNDLGLWITFSGQVIKNNLFSAGIDLKNGNLDNSEIYRTSTDEIATRGNTIFSALFVQDEIKIWKDRINIVAGIRLDYAKFYNGLLKVNNPTNKTGFQGDLNESFDENSWYQISPKLGLNYWISKTFRIYLNASTGFMPPKLDDLAGSRKIRRGFKIANPKLIPESITSFEWGLDGSIGKKFDLKPSLFYSRGHDFQYLVATGDFIDNGSEDPVPVYQRQNVSRVEVSGAELGVNYRINKNLRWDVSYTYNQSEILEYTSPGSTDLEGKVLNEVPENLLYTGFTWQNPFFNFQINYTFTDEQWYDEENTEVIESYSLVNLKISKLFLQHLHISLDIQDLLDEQFIDRKGYLSPGRFLMFEIKYTIHKNKKI
ncbi:MAG: TonB-dependent receptor [Bacteroidetes bacterium]|nr:TonB-dependent receptor [Bacteroidota bacterium]